MSAALVTTRDCTDAGATTEQWGHFRTGLSEKCTVIKVQPDKIQQTWKRSAQLQKWRSQNRGVRIWTKQNASNAKTRDYRRTGTKMIQRLVSFNRCDRQHRGRSEPHISRERTPHRGTNRATGSTSRTAGNLEGHPLSARLHYQACHWDKSDTAAGLENAGALSSARKFGKIKHRWCSNSRQCSSISRTQSTHRQVSSR